MKILFYSFLLLSFSLTGCDTSVPQRNYIGMTRSEVASVLEKEAFRDRWSGNRFAIWSVGKEAGASDFRTAQEVVDSKAMKWKQWRCDYYPIRHWLLSWNGFFAKWHFQVLEFENDRVVWQSDGQNYYWVHGYPGESPYPAIPWSAVPGYWGHYVTYTAPDGLTRKSLGEIIMLQNDEITVYSHQREIHAQFVQKDDFIEYPKKNGTKHQLFYDSAANEIYRKKPGYWYVIPEKIVYVSISEAVAKDCITQWRKELDNK